MRGGVYNGPNGEQLYGDGSEVEPMTVAKPITEHPAVRAAREILSNLRCEGYDIDPPSDMAVLKGAAMVRRAYAERDARVLKALEAAGEWCEIVMAGWGVCGQGDGKDARHDADSRGGTRLLDTLRAAIAELRGDTER